MQQANATRFYEMSNSNLIQAQKCKKGKTQEYILWGIFNFDTKTQKDWYKKIIGQSIWGT